MVKKFPLSNFKLWLFISALFAFSNAFSANWYVNDNSTAGDVYCSAIGSTSGTGTASNPFLTIKAARDHVATLAPGMHTIYVDTGTYVQSSSLIVSMNIANLTVTGAGYNKTICKGTGTSVFGTIDANNVTLNNLTLMDFAASAPSTGLALTVNAGKTGVLIENIRILNSGPTGSSSLGALLIQAQANVTINNSGFNCNLKTGIQVNGQGGGVNTAITTVNINNCHFSGNVTSAILNNGPFVHINVDNCVFEKNRAQNGGAIYFDSVAGKLTVTDSRFEGNYSTKAGSSTNGINGGGAIYIASSNNSGSDLILDRPNTLIQNCSFTGNYASANYSNGGAIHYASGVNNTVKNCSFQNNYTTVDASGTTISSGEDIYMNNSSAANLAVTIDGCSFNSIYTNDASAVNVYNGTGTFVTTASGLPTANGAGVAISKPEFFNSIAATTCSGCTTTNPMVTPTPTTEVVVCNPCSLITNAILSQPVCNNDTRCITLNNLPSGIWTITNDSPAVSVMGTGITTTICDLAPGTYSFMATVAGCSTEPSAPITIVAYTTPILTGTKTIYVNDASTTGDTFTSSVGNNANSGLTAALPKLTLTAALALAGPGDTILIDSGTYTDKNLTISIPSLTIKGAGDTKTIFNNNGASTNTNLLMTITSENVTIEAIGVTKYNNGVSSGASAISINGACNFLIRNVRVFQNLNAGGTDASIVITGSATGTFIGGGVNCNPNGASLGGGGVMISGAGNIVLFESYSFSKNPEDLVPGAGLSISGGGTSVVTIKNSVFDSNTYGGGTGGGAMYVYEATVNINGCKFLNNKCNNTGGGRSYGGAILVDSSSNVAIDNSVFTSNQAVTSGSGGAIAVNTSSSGTSSTVIITKTTFDSNTGAQGNHLYTKSGTGRPAAIIASNCTFVTNASNSVNVASGSITIANSGNVTGTGVTLTNTTAPGAVASPSVPVFDAATCTSALTCVVSLSYPNATICKNAATQTPTFSPAGGTFTSTAGLTIDATTGVITPSTSTAGTYTVTYTPDAADPSCNATFSITITAAPAQPTIACYETATFNTTSCAWDVTGTQPTQPTATNCWDDYQFNTTSCSWVNNGSQPTQPTATNCWDDYQFNTTSCSWVNNGSQPTQPTATNCWDDYQFNTTSCSWVNNGSQPTQPTATNCWDYYQFNTTSCSWVNNGSQPTQPTATNCWDDYQFNTTSCSWVNNGSQPTQPTATNCWDDYQFNTTSCSWVNNGSQPTQPTATNCWDDYQFNTTSCSWVNNGTQPTQPTATNCWDNYEFNTTSCSWVNNGSQPTQPTASNCWDNYQFNTASCIWVNNGSQPTQPTATNCWDNYQFNTASCIWVNNGSQPTQPTATNCWDDYQFNTTSCTWVNNGSQPTQPTATNCWDDYQFNTTSCTWVNNGSQPTQPAATNCWDDYQFNTTSCTWVNNGSQPTKPTATNCWDNYQFNTTSCTWDNAGSQPSQPAQVNCWDNYQFNTTSCTWVNNGSQPTQPTATNCWDDYQFNITSCSWVNNGSQPTQPTASNCWDDYQFNTTSCTWVNNGTQPTQPTATNCWDDYQFNTTSCSWVNNGLQPTQPTATNCWDNYQFNTTSCSWVNNGSQPTQPTATNCWDDYQFNTVSCIWVNNGSQPTQPTATNCWDNYQFNTTSCSWVNNGSQPTQPAIACYQTTTFNTTTCSWDVTGTQQPAPLITVNNAVCNGSTYSVEFNSNGTIVASSGTINGNTVNGIAVGTDLILTATSSNGCATSSISIISPTNCLTPRGCVNPILSAGQATCSGTGTYSFAFNVSQNADISTSAGTVSGNTVINIPIGTTVTLTATDGLCSTSIQVNSPLDCSTPCGSPLASFSAGICNGDTYSISISNPNGAIISSSLGTVTATAITGIPTGSPVTVISSLSGCSSQQITILSPIKIAPMLVVSNPICNGSTYSVTYSSNGIIDVSAGSLGSESIAGIPVGTDLLIIASSLNGCASTTITVKSPLNCTNPPTDCIVPTLSAGQGTCAGTGTYSFAFNASVGAVVSISSGTISGNEVTGIALGTNVTLTATNGSCVTSLVVNSPIDCSTPCATPVVSFSAGICNGTTYSINISNPYNATITTSAGIVTATAITGIPIGTSVTITSSISGCSPQIITISSPLIPVNPNAGNDGSIEICDGDVPTNSELFAALGGNPQSGGSWSNSGNIYTYTVLAASSCASLPLDRATVTVSTIIINDFEIVGHCNDSRYQLTINPVQSDAVYTWYNGIGDLIGTGNSMYINASDTYEVKSSKSICSKIKSIYIEDIHCIIPKGVSPNGDGLNDTWDLSNMNVEKAQIFNRYGMEMYSKSNYTDEWHGQTNDGQMLPSATYYYVLRFLDGTTKTGWVYLNREQ